MVSRNESVTEVRLTIHTQGTHPTVVDQRLLISGRLTSRST